MKVISSWKNLFTTGFKHHVYSDTPGSGCFYTTIEDEMGDLNYYSMPIRSDIQEWLESLPNWVYYVPEENWYRSSCVVWNRPILFWSIKHVILFKLIFEGNYAS